MRGLRNWLAAYAGVGTLAAGPAGFVLFTVHGLGMASMVGLAVKVDEIFSRRKLGQFSVSDLLAKLENVRIGVPEEKPPPVKPRSAR